MDFIVNLRTFLAVARLGSFSAAAREAGTVPSVVSKRVSQLEHMCRAQLFERSTRGLELTAVGRTCQQKFSELLSEIEATIQSGPARNRLTEHLRIKCPTTMSIMHFSDILCDFQIAHPGVRLDLNLVDRSVNPIEEGYDIAIGALPTTYPQVQEIALCALPRKLVAAPSYFDNRPVPTHPRDLSQLDALVFRASGNTWALSGPAGEVAVEVNPVFTASDTRLLCHAAIRGLGVTLIAEPLTRDAFAAGDLIEVLPDWRVPELYLKAMVPERRMQSPAVRLLLDTLVAATQPLPPWDRA
ncbi:LysR family transcriptional regulator [Pararhodobacter marinus]|uniref:LysR family transcriptional regulator n=1 Tax=Pararhodobacter marinus TaxID=2184063 RepID=UPI0035194F37